MGIYLSNRGDLFDDTDPVGTAHVVSVTDEHGITIPVFVGLELDAAVNFRDAIDVARRPNLSSLPFRVTKENSYLASLVKMWSGGQ